MKLIERNWNEHSCEILGPRIHVLETEPCEGKGECIDSRTNPEETTEGKYHTIIFDCSAWTMIDIVGMDTIKQVFTFLYNLLL